MYFGSDVHPYGILEQEIEARLRPTDTLLDAGCGRAAPVPAKYLGRAHRLIGVDLVDFAGAPQGLELYKGDISRLPLPDASVDLAYSRSVMEHVADPLAAFTELRRVIKPGGYYVFLTPSFYGYGSLIAYLVPNRLHPKIVRFAEGRAEEDVFPTHYRTNTRGRVAQFAAATGFVVTKFRYLGQYPAYLSFSPALFRLASDYELLLRRFESLAPLRGWIFAILQKQA